MGSPFEATDLDHELNALRRDLFKSAMTGEWRKVVAAYKVNPKAHTAQITKSGDTALHLAVRDDQGHVVAELLRLISMFHPGGGAEEALKIVNDRKNTVLHIAASLGNVNMCKCICDAVLQAELPSLLGARNEDGESPLFRAALHGKKEAFLCLHAVCPRPIKLSYSRRNDGDTILHAAIAGEFFDLAFQIIHLCEDLVDSVNQEGCTPLHLLASKPRAFRSGSHLAGCHKFIYNCIFVDELKADEKMPKRDIASTNNEKSTYPRNYETCMNFLLLTKKPFKFAMNLWKTISQGQPGDAENQQGNQLKISDRSPRLIPPNYDTCFELVKFVSKAMLIILGLGSLEIKKLQEKKKKNTWSVQIAYELLLRAKMYEHDYTGKLPRSISSDEVPYSVEESGKVKQNTATWGTERKTDFPPNKQNLGNNGKGAQTQEKPKTFEMEAKETAILMAAKNGITEIVEKILEKYPVAIHDKNAQKKNVVLLAVEHRQPHVYQLLLKRKVMRDSIFRKVDDKGNSAMHLAATLGDNKPWRIPGAALQMQWEIKWYEFVKNSMPPQFFARHNKENKTPRDIFTETHVDLVKNGGKWLTSTSESCSVVAALIATVAFATSATVPGGVNQDSGRPTLEMHPAFNVFAISSLVALCFSVTAVVMFLAILTSRYEEKDFGKDLPRKLLFGLSSLFVSIAAILVSFCSGHFFVLRDQLKYAALPVYALTCFPVTFFAVAQFPLYIDLIWATIKKVPQRSYMVVR